VCSVSLADHGKELTPATASMRRLFDLGELRVLVESS
jgi:hypothetical protein